jgi:hypothetical protein
MSCLFLPSSNPLVCELFFECPYWTGPSLDQKGCSLSGNNTLLAGAIHRLDKLRTYELMLLCAKITDSK